MAAEHYINFTSVEWYKSHSKYLQEGLRRLPTYRESGTETEHWLKGSESAKPIPSEWPFDVRIFFGPQSILLEISAHPPSVEEDIRTFCRWISKSTEIAVVDDDGNPTNYL